MVSIKLNENIIAKFDKLYEHRTKGALGKKTKERLAQQAAEMGVDNADSIILDTNPVLEPVQQPSLTVASPVHAKDIKNDLKKIEKRNIRDIWNQLVDRTEKAIRQEENIKKNTTKQKKNTPVDISKLDKVKVRRMDGSVDVIEPARIAKLVKFFIGQLSKYEDTKVLRKYFPKNIIWTFEVPTAATDGVRVFFNPAFADRLLGMDMVLIDKRTKDDPYANPDDMSGTMVQFVLIHEIYHQIYRHMHRIRMKPETAGALTNRALFDLCNIACDVEINRDIEYQIPRFAGCTEILEGMFDKRFPHQTWELIYDAYTDPENGIEPPSMQQDAQGKNPQQGQQGQLGDEQQGGGDGQGDDSQDSSDDNSLNQSDLDNTDENGEYNDDKNNAGKNGQPSLDNKSEAYLRGFREALEKIKSGEIDPANWSGMISETVNFNAMLDYRTKGALGKKTIAAQLAAQQAAGVAQLEIPTVNATPTINTQPVQASPVNEEADYKKGFADAVKMAKQMMADKNKNKNNNQNNQQGDSNMPGMPDDQQQDGNDSDGLNGQNQDGQNGEQGDNSDGGSGGDGQGDDDDVMYDERSHGRSGGQSGQSGNNQGQGGESSGGQGGGQGNQQMDDSDEGDTISGEGMEAQSGDGKFNSNDMIDHETAKKLAENAGQPYDADDMAEDPEQKAKDFVNNNRNALSNIGKNHGKGTGKSLGDVLDHIDTLFKSTVNWKNQLQAFLNSLAKTGKDYEFQRRRIGTDNPVLRPSRYIKYNEVTFDQKAAVAQVFYLIDNSGSMYSQSKDNGQTVFMQIFSDILSMQKRAKIQKSALTYFSYGEIDKAKIRLWDAKTSVGRIKELIGRNKDDSGGTDIVGSINQIYNMGKPYYSKVDPKTLMVVMTDGEDNLTIVKDLPSTIKLNIIFMILNSDNRYLDSAQKQLTEAGIKRSRILLVDTNDIAKK